MQKVSYNKTKILLLVLLLFLWFFASCKRKDNSPAYDNNWNWSHLADVSVHIDNLKCIYPDCHDNLFFLVNEEEELLGKNGQVRRDLIVMSMEAADNAIIQMQFLNDAEETEQILDRLEWVQRETIANYLLFGEYMPEAEWSKKKLHKYPDDAYAKGNAYQFLKDNPTRYVRELRAEFSVEYYDLKTTIWVRKNLFNIFYETS